MRTPPVKQPNSSQCFVCGVDNRLGFGLSFYETSADTVEASATIPDHFQGYPGVAHGGIVSALLDEIAVRAAIAGEPDHLMITARMDVRFRKVVPVGKPLRLIGRRLARSSRATKARAEVVLSDGSVAANAEGLFVDHPESGMDSEALAALGWRIIPD